MGRTGMGSRPLRSREPMPEKSSRAPPYDPLGPQGPRPLQLAHRMFDTTQPGQLHLFLFSRGYGGEASIAFPHPG